MPTVPVKIENASITGQGGGMSAATITGDMTVELSIWGPTDPRPSPPIVFPPGYPAHPIQPPLGIWGGAPIPWPTPPIFYPPGIWGPTDPFPTPPIAIPPTQPPTEPQPQPPSDKWSWYYVDEI